MSAEGRLAELPVDITDLPADVQQRVRDRAARPDTSLSIGRYVIVGEIGRGGMGLVYECWDPRIERQVAVKTIEPDLVPDEQEREEVIERFLRETKVVGRLRNPGIVTIFDYGEDPELERGGDPFAPGRTYYYVMEYLDGMSLSRMLRERNVLPDVEAVAFSVDVADALAVAHDQGIIHRDIKPSNIFIRNTKQAVLLDFGIAKTASRALTRQGQILGTPSYLAPERLREKEVPLDGRADLFSLGVLLYTMLVGEAPFVGENVYDLIDNIAKKAHPRLDRATPGGVALSEVLDRLLAKSPEDRYSDARQAASKLRDVLAQLRNSTPDVSDLAGHLVPVHDTMGDGATEVASASGPVVLPVSRVEPAGTKPEVQLHRRTRQIKMKDGGSADYEAAYPSPRVYDASDLEELDEDDLQLLDDAPATNDIPARRRPEPTQIDGPRVAVIPEPRTLQAGDDDDDDDDITRPKPGDALQTPVDDRAATPSAPADNSWDLEPEHEPTKEAPVRRFSSVASEDETIAEPEGLPDPFLPQATLTDDQTLDVHEDDGPWGSSDGDVRRRRPRQRIQASLVDEADVIVQPAPLDALKPDETPTQTAVPTPTAPDPVIGKPYDPLETEVVRTRGLPRQDPAERRVTESQGRDARDPAEPRQRKPRRRASTPLLRRRNVAPGQSAAVVRKTIGVQKPSGIQQPPTPLPEGFADIQVSGADLDDQVERERLVRNRAVILLGAAMFAVAIGLLVGKVQQRQPATSGGEDDVLPVPALTAKPGEPTPPALVPPRSAAAILEDASAAFDGGDLPEADRLYMKALEASAEGSDAHLAALLGRARTMTKAGARSKATSLYEQVLELQSTGPVADEARSALEVDAEGKRAAAPRRRGPPKRTRRAAAEPEEPEEPAPKVRQPAASKVSCRDLAMRYMSDPRSGVVAFQRLTEASPKLPCGFKHLGAFCLRVGDDRGALGAYERYLALSPAAQDRRAVEGKIASLRRRTRP